MRISTYFYVLEIHINRQCKDLIYESILHNIMLKGKSFKLTE